MEKEQREAEERLQREVETHIECLRKLKADMIAREKLRARQVGNELDSGQSEKIGKHGGTGVLKGSFSLLL